MGAALQQAEALAAQDGGTDEVVARFRAVLDAYPDSPLVLARYAAFADNVLENPEEAQGYYEQALALKPTDAAAVQLLASFLANYKDDLEGAKEMYDRGLAAHPTDAVLLDSYGFFLQNVLGRTEEAMQCLSRAVECAPANPQILSHYAAFLRSVCGDFAGAEEALMTALGENDEDADLLFQYADLLDQCMGQSDRAIPFYELALQADEEHLMSHNNIAALLIEQAKDKAAGGKTEASETLFADASAHLEVVEAASPGLASYNLACIAALREDEAGAQQWLTHGAEQGGLPKMETILQDDDIKFARRLPFFQDLMLRLQSDEAEAAAAQ